MACLRVSIAEADATERSTAVGLREDQAFGVPKGGVTVNKLHQTRRLGEEDER